MKDEKIIAKQVEKLGFILSRYNGADVELQFEVLSHILGDYKSGLSIQLKADVPNEWTTSDKLLRYLQEGVSKLVTLSYNSLSKSESDNNEKTQELRRLREENEDLIFRNKELSKQVKQYRDAEKIRVTVNQDLNIPKNDEVIDLSKYYAMANDELQDKIKQLKRDIKKYEGVYEENLKLKVELQNVEDALHSFEETEKALLPELQKGCFCKKYRGKSISLEPSQIEKVVSGYLYGNSNYKISKDLGISHTTVKKILECDYSTSSSLNKILSALHSVNGNWGSDRKKLLENLIEEYEFAIKKATIDDRNNKLKIKGSITSLEDYINFKKSK